MQGIPRGACCNACHAGRAFRGSNLHQPIDGKICGTGACTFSAIDAGIGIAANLDRAEQGRETKQRAIGAEIAAPEVLDEDGEQNQEADDDGRGQPDIAEEVQHLHICDQAIWRRHEVLNRFRGHGADDEDEEAEQQILEAAQRKIDPPGQAEIAFEDSSAQLPQLFRERSHRAQP